jgi:hypothetical protein
MRGAALSAYDDKDKIGESEDHGRRHVEAFALVKGKRKSLGIFKNRQEATRALDHPMGAA